MEVLRVMGWGSAASREGLCAIGSLSGGVQVFPMSQPGAGVLSRAGPGKVHSVLWVGQAEGQGIPAGVRGRGASLSSAVYLNRPQGALWVCGDRRGSLLLFEERKHQQEKKRGDGAEHRYEEIGREARNGTVESNDEKGDVTVREVDKDKREASPPACELSVWGAREAGGDRWLCESPPGLEVLRVCRGMEWLERVLLLEPQDSEEDQRVQELEGTGSGSGKEARFVIIGYHSVHLVVWDPMRQERLLSVPCGGGHRSWSNCPHQYCLSVGQGALVFIKQVVVLASQPSGEASSRAGSLGLREGLLGRGVGCVCRMGVVEAGEGCREVLVTGGEDTSLIVLAVRLQTGTVRVLSVLTDHISNVRTLTAVKRLDGRTDRGTDEHTATQALSALFVSAGGWAQMQCFRLLIGGNGELGPPSCQVIQHLQGGNANAVM
ncbi:unnamed protein product [Coregonus sp. 'balchen']|nr:unnamed protein product [Coregonus sp. 'balchen']